MTESEVVKAIRKQREEIARNELDTLRRMARLWVPSYRYLQEQVSALMRIIQDKQNKGDPVEMEYIYSLRRYQTMMEQAAVTIRKYNKAIAGLINGAEAEATDLGQSNASSVISIAEPDHELWTRVNRRETTIAAGMTAEGSPLDSLLEKSFGQMKEGMEQALITGISTGQGSAWIADQIMQAAQIPERRALLIARTEVNRAYRQSNWNQMRSSRAVLGYRRMCYPDTACFACLMLDKEFYPIDSEPCDHPNGKCSFVPVTRHFDPGNDPGWQGGREYFDSLPEDAQRKLMGPGRFDLWKQGGVDPRDMVWIKPNKVWGGSPAIRPLEDLQFKQNVFTNHLSQYSRPISSSKRNLIEYEDLPQSPEDAQKFEELSTRVYKNFHFRLSDEVKGLDYGNVSAGIEAIIETADRFPELKNIISGFGVIKDGGNLMQTVGNGTVNFNRLFYAISTKTNMLTELQTAPDKPKAIKNYSEKSIGYHEAGHLLSILIGYKKGGSMAYASYTYKTGEIAQNIIREAVKSYNLRYNSRRKWLDIAGNISDRAKINQNETFAECVSDYMTNRSKSNRFSKIVWELIERELDQNGNI